MPTLGLVCITHGPAVRYKTITRTRLLQHPEAAREGVLRALYEANLAMLEGALAYCERERIGLYRMPSSLFPFLDTDTGRAALAPLHGELAHFGAQAVAQGLRLVMHPDQFVVLSSDSEAVVANSVRILEMHAEIMDLLRQPRSPWALLEIHGGKANRAEALVARIAQLPDGIRLRLGLENDEYAYGAEEILAICHASGVPMVFDAHHHVVHEGLDSYEDPSVADILRRARATWAVPEHQLVHISNGREAFGDRSHSDLIATMPSAYAEAPWIEIEAKLKEEAIRGVRAAAGPWR